MNRVNGHSVAEKMGAATRPDGAAPAPEVVQRHPETGIDVLIVGAGMGGLMSALECWRKGHNIVGVLERNDGPVYTGENCCLSKLQRLTPD